jgi:hypothetical protein
MHVSAMAAQQHLFYLYGTHESQDLMQAKSNNHISKAGPPTKPCLTISILLG